VKESAKQDVGTFFDSPGFWKQMQSSVLEQSIGSDSAKDTAKVTGELKDTLKGIATHLEAPPALESNASWQGQKSMIPQAT
jgi:hypothetical protein